ncbi:MAG: cytochrome b/b6 domain-containing protein [Granulosicoccus sp.]|nr:cytochrome b/b6 domain-containing protein [Granulosicoccus sp.]
MDRSAKVRYGDIAVLLHWLIALLIIGLLAIGKYMVSLEESDPVRFALTQWHKSFGFSVLALSVVRLIWRMMHSPPRDPDTLPKWQKTVAHAVHHLLYALMFILPLSGWILVSASPLNIDTIWFDVIPIPHLPPFEQSVNKEQVAGLFAQIHELAGNLLILLLLAHIGAALKHHLIDKDEVLLRMTPRFESRAFKAKLTSLLLAMAGLGTGLYLSANSGNDAAVLAAGTSEVSFVAEVTGESATGFFTESEVTAMIDQSDPAQSSISATVQTASISSDNSQLEGTLPDTEWFDSANYAEAVFSSSLIAANDDGSLQVTGQLTIKKSTHEVSFPMTITLEEDKQVARGEFTIDRRDFDIGMASQESEDSVAHIVTVRFRFDTATPDG